MIVVVLGTLVLIGIEIVSCIVIGMLCLDLRKVMLMSSLVKEDFVSLTRWKQLAFVGVI